MGKQRYAWKRFWCPPEGTFHLTDDGYLWDPESEWLPTGISGAVAFESITGVPCLGLLGEPGTGKSTEMRLQYEMVRRRSGEIGDVALWFDLRDYDSGYLVSERVFGNPEMAAWKKGTCHLHLFLDSLDEGLLSVETLKTFLPTELEGVHRHMDRLSVRIACRTLEWPGILEDQLKELWGRDRVRTYELLPLRHADVAEAARREGLDPDAFLDEVARREAAPLAIKPITLNFLLGLARRGQGFPDTRCELYEEGCRILCEEHSPSRRASRPAGSLSAEQRFAIAARLAALTVLGNQAAVWTGPSDGTMPESDLRLAEACGGTEQFASQSVEVVPATIAQTLNTGLFSSRGRHRMGWAHQSYGEFLAAWYLAHRKMPLTQVKSLIVHPSAPKGKLVPQLHEAAAWLAAIVPGVLDHTADADPQVLLRSDLTATDIATREKVARGILKAFEREELLDADRRLRGGYGKLAYPGLAGEVRPYITGRGKPWLVRRVAVDIAEACALKELQDELLCVVLDPEDDYGTRVQAAYALHRIGDDETKGRMRPLVYGQSGDDPDDELKGCALLALWPDGVPTSELFRVLTTPKNPNLIGAYGTFLHHLGRNLTASDLPVALAWVKQSPDWGLAHPFRRLVDDVVEKAWEHSEGSEILGLLAEIVVESLRADHCIVTEHYSEAFAQKVQNEPEKRRRLIAAMLPLLGEGDARDLAVTPHGQAELVTQDDVPWLIALLGEGGSDERQRAIAELVRFRFTTLDPDQAGEMFVAAQQYPALWEKVRRFFEPIRLDSPEFQKRYREHLELEELKQRRDERQRSRPDPKRLIIRFAEELESGEDDAWWHLNWAMAVDREGHVNEFESDLTVLPGWEDALGILGEERIAQAADQYLRERDPETERWLGTNVMDRPAWAGYRALRLLAGLAPDRLHTLPDEIWKRWAATTIAYPISNADEESHRGMVALAYQAAPEEIIHALMMLIEKENDQHDHIFVIRKVERCWDEGLAQALLAKAQEPHLKPPCMRCLLIELIKRDFAGARAFAESVLSLPIPAAENPRGRAVAAGTALMIHAGDCGWAAVWPAMQADVEFGRAVVSTVAGDFEVRESRPEHRLSDDQLADLYVWVTRQYPYGGDPGPLGPHHWVGAREQIERWRDSLLTELKGRGTSSSTGEMRRIVRELPEADFLKWHLLEAQEIAYRRTWVPPTAGQVLKLVRRREARLVSSGAELTDLLTESLQRLQMELKGELPAVRDLWNDRPRVPKDENPLSDYVARHLRRDLSSRGIVVNREVQVRQGQRTDIHVDAVAPGEGSDHTRVLAIIEVKGCWHPHVYADMKRQLVDRYMAQNDCDCGLYLVLSFNCDQWHDADRRKRDSKTRPIRRLKEILQAKATELSGEGRDVRVVVIDAALRS